MTLGQTIRIDQGVELVAIISVGQNRWMFSTTNLGYVDFQLNPRNNVQAMRLVLPEKVERCQRRNYYRVETAALRLPNVDIWPLLDPKTVVVAERANELKVEMDRVNDPAVQVDDETEMIMPEVGPRFTAQLVNIGGGGVGLNIQPGEANNFCRHKLFWTAKHNSTLD